MHEFDFFLRSEILQIYKYNILVLVIQDDFCLFTDLYLYFFFSISKLVEEDHSKHRIKLSDLKTRALIMKLSDSLGFFANKFQ